MTVDTETRLAEEPAVRRVEEVDRASSRSGRRLRVLRIMLTAREQSAEYGQFSLPLAEEYDLTVCTYFSPEVTFPETISLFPGNTTLRGFLRALRAALDAKQYDIIHAHSPHVGLFFLVANVLFRQQPAVPTVYTVHDSYPNYKLRNRLMLLPVFAGFRKVVCCGRSSYDSFPTLYRWLAGARLTYVRNGLDIARVDRIAAKTVRHRRRATDFKVVAVSRLVAIKNPFAVINAFQLSKDQHSRLLYIGDGPLRDSLGARSNTHGLADQAAFTGVIPRDKVFEHLLTAELFISTSRGEGLPVAVLEAMACGRPVLLSDIPPHREIAEGVDFIPLIPPDDEAGFARQIERFREMSAAERSAIGRECRALVEKRFSMAAMHAGYAEIYAQMTANKGVVASPAGAR